MRLEDLYKHTEQWWGDPLDGRLIDRISNAPRKHLQLFSESLQDFDTHLEPISSGKLRPVVGRTISDSSAAKRHATALRILLYSHEVVLDTEDVDTFLLLHRTPRSPDVLKASLQRLVEMRPLVEDGSVHLSPMASRALHPSIWGQYEELLQDTAVRELALQIYTAAEETYRHDDFEKSLEFVVSHCFGQMTSAFYLGAVRKAHPLARSSMDRVVLDVLLRRGLTDRRQSLLSTLASLQVPHLESRVTNLIQLRQSDVAFAQWRAHLNRALLTVEDLTADASSLDEASEIVTGELMEGLNEVRKATEKSPIIRAMTGGMTGFGVAAVSAGTTGALTGNPWVALASGTAGKAADAGLTYIRALRERQQGRLIMDVALSFVAPQMNE